jgi:hypothetical protein
LSWVILKQLNFLYLRFDENHNRKFLPAERMLEAPPAGRLLLRDFDLVLDFLRGSNRERICPRI